MKGKDISVFNTPNGWVAKTDGASQAAACTQTQSEAIKIAKAIAQKRHAEVSVHGRNGKIREKWSYGKEPFPPRG